MIGIFASFFLMLAFANLIDQATLGIYQYLIATVSIIASISLTGINSAIIRATSKRQFSFLTIALRYAIYSAIFPLVIALIAASYYTFNGNFIFAGGILFGTIALLLLQIQLRYNAIYVGIEEFKRSNYLLKASALGPLLILLPALFFLNNPAILVILYFTSSLLGVSLVLFVLKTKKQIAALTSQHQSTFDESKNNKKNLWFSFHQSIVAVMNTAASHLDRIIVFQLLGPAATAIYFISMSIPDRLRNILKQFEPYLFSKFSKYTPEAAASTLGLKFVLGLIAIIPFFLCYILIAPHFFRLFLPQYIEAIPLTIMYSATLFASVAVIPYSKMKAHSKDAPFYIFTILFMFLKIIFIGLGAFHFGLEGAIVGATLATLLSTLNVFLLAKKM